MGLSPSPFTMSPSRNKRGGDAGLMSLVRREDAAGGNAPYMPPGAGC